MKIGIRDLKNKAPQVVREVRETGETAEITYRGQVVAWLTPATDSANAVDYKTAWKTLDKVAADIGRASKPRRKPAPQSRAAGWRREL
jgi:prevent-host-death family protein